MTFAYRNDRLGTTIEKIAVGVVCLWGNWAIYYWMMVIIFSASFNDLKTYSPILALQFICSFLLLQIIGISSEHQPLRNCSSPQSGAATLFSKKYISISICAVLLGFGLVFLFEGMQWTRSFVGYNLLWVVLLPFSIWHFFHLKPLTPASTSNVSDTRPPAYDSVIFLASGCALMICLYGTGFPTPDDAFYANVMSSALAHPELPILGQDLLMGTSAPYTLHPSYQTVGFEVFIALLASVFSLDHLFLYFDAFPSVGAFLWLISTYLLFRVLCVPFPGISLTVCSAVLLFWAGGRAPGGYLLHLFWGKGLVAMVASPLLFSFVAIYLRSYNRTTWFMLLLAVCSVGVWSSTALFVIPVSLCIAMFVFPSAKNNGISPYILVLVTLLPIMIVLLNSLVILNHAPVNTEGGAGWYIVNGELYGGLIAKCLLLGAFLSLPIIARAVGDHRFHTTILRFSLAGVFTAFAPYLFELIAKVTGITLLSWRLHYSYPAYLIVGILAGIAFTLSRAFVIQKDATSRLQALSLLGIVCWYCIFLVLIEKRFLFGDWRTYAASIYGGAFEEAKEARKLIPGNAFVAAGHLNESLPITRDPPTFVSVRHYLNYHRFFVSERDYADRVTLTRLLKDRTAAKDRSIDETIILIVKKAEALEVTSIVFLAKPGFAPKEKHASLNRFVYLLTDTLEKSGYSCATTVSGQTRVCNRKADAFGAKLRVDVPAIQQVL